MKLYTLGKVPWRESQLVYHALAEMGREGLSLVSPSSAYVCLGFHQHAAQEVDLEYCDARGIPVFRRDLGGGAVYLDGDQYFFQLILHRDNPLVPKNKSSFYQKFLGPILNVYRRIGIPVEYKPVNDVVCGARKISGTGAGEIGDCVVFVGNLIMDFDFREMSRVLNVPDEKFRDKVYKTLTDNLTTIRRELGGEAARQWSEERLNEMMAEEFQAVLGPMEPAAVDPDLAAKVRELDVTMTSDAWTYRKGKKTVGRDVKIRSGVNVVHRAYKAPGGLIRCEMEWVEGTIRALTLSGDFFCFPKDSIVRLEQSLVGKTLDDVEEILEAFYAAGDVEIPGVQVTDWMELFAG
jgi:lipoate-protein ligase A